MTPPIPNLINVKPTAAHGAQDVGCPSPQSEVKKGRRLTAIGGLRGREIMPLTGRFNFKKTWRGKLNLIVEEEYRSKWAGEKRRWRAASLSDLAEPEMRTLIDFRFQRRFASASYVAPSASSPAGEASPSSLPIKPFAGITGASEGRRLV
jgi:hypothetical protein